MKRRFVKLMAVAAILAGGLLLVLEVRKALATGEWDIWVWGVIALLAIAFGVAELVAKDAPPGKGEGEPPDEPS